jgi:hypothetical protein
MNKFLKKSSLVAAVASLSGVVMSSANAAIDITTDITAAKTDVTSNGVAVLGVLVAVAVIAWVRRVLR